MISTEPLESKITSPPERELSETDPVLDKIISLAEHRQYIAAAERCEELWRQRVYDVRTLGFYLFGFFFEQGLIALAPILGGLETTLALNWPFIGPAATRQRHCESALRWLFLNIMNQLRFYQNKPGETWTGWLKQWEEPLQRLVLERISRLVGVIDSVMPESQCKGQLLTLHGLLQALPSVPAAAGPGPGRMQPEEAGKSVAAAAHPEQVLTRSPDAASPPNTLANTQANDASTPATLTIPLSPALQVLLRKLVAFNQLVKMGKFRQAWLVYNDVKNSIEKFDPRVYLPSLFGEYFSNLVANAERLNQRPGNLDDFAGQALLELYQTDIDRFVASKG